MNRPKVIQRLSISSLSQSQDAVVAFEKHGKLSNSPSIEHVDSLSRTYEIRLDLLLAREGGYASRLAAEISEFLENLRQKTPECLVPFIIQSNDPHYFIVFAEGGTFDPLSCLKVKPNSSEDKLRFDRGLGIDV